MFDLSQWPIRRQVLAAILVSITALVGVSGTLVLERWHVMRLNAETIDLAAAVTKVSALAHELQKERGASALFLGSKGQQFQSELTAQRERTDGAAQDLTATLAGQACFLLAAGDAAALDPAALGREVAALLDARGGGNGRLFQGKAGSLARRDQALARLRAASGAVAPRFD